MKLVADRSFTEVGVSSRPGVPPVEDCHQHGGDPACTTREAGRLACRSVLANAETLVALYVDRPDRRSWLADARTVKRSMTTNPYSESSADAPDGNASCAAFKAVVAECREDAGPAAGRRAAAGMARRRAVGVAGVAR